MAANQRGAGQERQVIPLRMLLNLCQSLIKVISRVDRTSYFRLLRTNKTMKNFMDSNKTSIKNNLLRDITVKINHNDFDFGFAKLHYGKDQSFYICKMQGNKAVGVVRTMEEVTYLLKGCKPARVVYNLHQLSLATRPEVDKFWLCGNTKESRKNEKETDFYGVLERVSSFEMQQAFTVFPETAIRRCFKNWTARLNRMSCLGICTTNPNSPPPDLSSILFGVKNTTITYHELPYFMKIPFERDVYAQELNFEKLEIRLIKNPKEKATAYVYRIEGSTIGFRAFDFFEKTDE